MMRGLSAFLLPELLALLGDAERGERRAAAMDSQSEPMSEDSESQASQRLETPRPPRLVMVRSTNSAAQTVVLVDRDHSMEAFVPVAVLEALHAQMRYKSLARLRGSVLRVVKYQFATRARCLASGQLEASATARWAASVSMAAPSRRQQRLYLWIEELSVVDASELVVDPLPDVIEVAEIAKLLGALTDAELEARVTIRQKLSPLPTANLSAVASPVVHFGDGNPLSDADCIIPEEQERELDEQDGWGPPPAPHAGSLPTDSQLIEENGPVSTTEVQDASDSCGHASSARSEAGGVSASFPIEPASPYNEEAAGPAVPKQRSHPSGSETVGEHEARNSLEVLVSATDEPPEDRGSVNVPIDLTADEDEDSSVLGEQSLSQDYIYDDSEIFTQPPDVHDGFRQTQDQFQEASQADRGQSNPEIRVVDDPELYTQLPDQSFEVESQETGDDEETQLPSAEAGLTDQPQVAEVRPEPQIIQSQPVTETQDDDASPHLQDAHGSEASEDGEEVHMDADAIPSTTGEKVLGQLRRPQDGQAAQSQQLRAEGRDYSSEDASADQPRGLGGFFRRLVSNLGIVSSRKESIDRPSGISPRPKGNDISADATGSSKPDAWEVSDSVSFGTDGGDDGQSQTVEALADENIWQTQAPDVVESSGDERASSPSPAPDFGYEPDVGDVNITVAIATSSASHETSADRVPVDVSQVSDDEDHAMISVNVSTRTALAPASDGTTATMTRKRRLRDDHDTSQTSSPAVPSSLSPSSPSAVHRGHRTESIHNERQADKNAEKANETESSIARKRIRLEHPPSRDVSTTTHTVVSGRGSFAFTPNTDRLWAELGLGNPTSTPASVPARMRPSKRLEAFFPPLLMDRILQQIVEKEA